MLARGFGGAQRSFVDTALALAERGHQVQAICHQDFVQQQSLEGVPNLRLHPVRVGVGRAVGTAVRIAILLRRFKADIVHTSLTKAALHGGRAGRLARVPLVAKLHNYVKLGEYGRVHTLIAPTEDQRGHVLAQGWPADRVTVVPYFSRVRPVDSARLPGTRPTRLLAYGRHVHKKGFDVLLRAFKRLLDGGVDCELAVGGHGPESPRLRDLANDLGIAGQVRLGPWIDDVRTALDEADVFVLPSRREPFGIVMLEAMARGLPIVTTRTQGPVQVLTDDLATFVDIDSVDALSAGLREAAENPATAHKKAAAALELYRTTYHADVVLPRLEGLYDAIVSP